ncbi:MAG TPA: hypothetical protein VI168_19065 [Croceibacterium sp.]
MSAVELKQRLRADLKAAMQARASDEVRLLRTLIAALDNAEAVPGGGLVDKYVPRSFGDPSGEVARLALDDAAVGRVLADEISARLAAADEYQRHGETAEEARLRREAQLIARYRA